MKKCVRCMRDRVLAVLAAVCCGGVAVWAVSRERSFPALFVGVLFGGVCIRILWRAYREGGRGFYYDEERIIFALSRKDRREFRWEELGDALAQQKICIFYQPAPAVWRFSFPGKLRMKELSVTPRMEGYEALVVMLARKKAPALRPSLTAASEKEALEQLCRTAGEHLAKEERQRK